MACKNVCKLCNRLILSQQLIFTDGNLYIFIPEGSYNNGEKYCIVVAQSIPSGVTIDAPVIVRIGDGVVDYPMTRNDGSQLYACAVRSRTKYATRVITNQTGGNFQLIGNACCQPNNNLDSINGDAPS